MPRKPGGPKTGGRQKGTPNKNTVQREIAFAQVRASALSDLTPEEIAVIQPREVMLLVMRTALQANNAAVALVAAEKAAPYIHARLSNVEMHATVRRNATDFSDAELAALAGADGGDESESRTGEAERRTH